MDGEIVPAAQGSSGGGGVLERSGGAPDAGITGILGFGVYCGEVDGGALCRMFNTAIVGTGRSTSLSSDHHPMFRSHRWKAK